MTFTAQDLINGFEDEQKTVVFSALSEYLALATFTDVTLVCRGNGGQGYQQLKAHKIVLASSSKFFRDIFRHNPMTQVVELDKELAPNDLFLTFEDVQLIIGILYCVGTVEISPQRIQSLHLAAQILGIPTLIRFLKKIKDSLAGSRDLSSETFVNYPSFHGGLMGGELPRFEYKAAETGKQDILFDGGEGDGENGYSDSKSKEEAPAEAGTPRGPAAASSPRRRDEEEEVESRPSRTQSRTTLASLDSFSLQQLPSPIPREAAEANPGGDGSRVVASVLETFDPSSFLNHLPANQIDDLENALLPHLHSEESQPAKTEASMQQRSNATTHRVRMNLSIGASENLESNQRLTEIDEMVFEDGNSTREGVLKGLESGYEPDTEPSPQPVDFLSHHLRPALVGAPVGFSIMLPSGNQNLQADPVILRPCLSPQPVRLQQSLVDLNVGSFPDGSRGEPFHCPVKRVHGTAMATPASSFQTVEEVDSNDNEEEEEEVEGGEVTAEEGDTEGNEDSLVIDEERQSEERSRSQLSDRSSVHEPENSNEIRVNLETAKEGKSFKFAIPGSSKSVTLNFSADALQEMRNSVTKKEPSGEQETTSSMKTDLENDVPPTVTEPPLVVSQTLATKQLGSPKTKRPPPRQRRKKAVKEGEKSPLTCHICSKSLSSKTSLDKHLTYHVEVNSTCHICGKLFTKKYALQQHMAVDHGMEENLKCEDCGKGFKWSRNFLAHIRLCHVEEKRYRCKFCPLTFLQRKSYVNHQRSKHAQKPETFCKLCLDVFDSTKLRQDHVCQMFENTGNVLICHRHKTPKKFRHQADMAEHLKSHSEENVSITHKFSCPVCHMSFIMKKNLHTHLRRFHEREGKKAEHKCQYCEKMFYFKTDRDEHENTHTGERNFQCHCGRSYSSKKALLHHDKLVHVAKDEVHVCAICGKKLSNKYKLKYHMSVHSDKRSFKCSTCGLLFKARENLAKHVNKKHKEQMTNNIPSVTDEGSNLSSEGAEAAAQAAVRDDNVEREEVVTDATAATGTDQKRVLSFSDL